MFDEIKYCEVNVTACYFFICVNFVNFTEMAELLKHTFRIMLSNIFKAITEWNFLN